MSTVLWLVTIAAVCWVGVAVCASAAFVIAYRAVVAEEQQGMEPAAPAPARETTPGGLTADLGNCWGIWPDAPLATAAPDDH